MVFGRARPATSGSNTITSNAKIIIETRYILREVGSELPLVWRDGFSERFRWRVRAAAELGRWDGATAVMLRGGGGDFGVPSGCGEDARW